MVPLERSTQLQALPIVHGFTTRRGGVSVGRYATLNLGRRWGDEAGAVQENYRRVADAGGFSLANLRTVKQVHGVAVVRADQVTPDSEADAIWARREDGAAVVGVLTADCVPVLIADDEGRVVAAVHSGWRGTAANIAAATVSTLADAGVSASRLRAAIGPCIELDAFEVGPEVAAEFPERVVAREGFRRPHVDLVAMVRLQLEAAGVPAAAIERVGGCTHRDGARYFSFRRDGAGIGQQLSFIGFPER
ncbi:MAG: laccase domain-containing protein [Myxococcales bacterium]|nr:laccase domain-containing protein [Myxococcales bacterium]